MNAAPSLAYTADTGWHLTGGEIERLVCERDEARRECQRLRQRIAELEITDHGVTAYTNGCRCDVCREAKRISNARWYQSRKRVTS